jgi:hypothetical protein
VTFIPPKVGDRRVFMINPELRDQICYSRQDDDTVIFVTAYIYSAKHRHIFVEGDWETILPPDVFVAEYTDRRVVNVSSADCKYWKIIEE